MTELKDFIKATLIAITDAVAECQRETKTSALVAPIGVVGGITNDPAEIKQRRSTRSLHNIDFDVCVTDGSDAQKGSNFGGSVKCFFAGQASSSGTKMENVSRVKFSIPVAYPAEIVSPPNGEDPDPVPDCGVSFL